MTQNRMELCEPRYELTFSFTETYLLDLVVPKTQGIIIIHIFFSSLSLRNASETARGLGYNDLFDFEIEPNAERSVGTVKEKGASACQ